MKILILNGSPRPNGNTKQMIDALCEGLKKAGHEWNVVNVARMNIHGCLACEYCHGKGAGNCVQKDDMQNVYELLKTAEMLVLAAPIYYHGMSGQMKCCIDRFYAVLYPEKPAYQYIDLANRAEFYYHAGEYDKTEEIIAQFDTLPELTNQVYLSQVHYTKALLSMRNRDYDEAMRHAELGRQYGEMFHAFQNQIACTELMMKVDLARNDLPSYVLHDGQNDHLDSLSRGTEVNYQIALIEGRGEAMLVEQEIKRKETIFFFLWVLTAMLFIGLFVFFYYHRKTAKARLHLAELQKQQLDEEVTQERLEKELAELKAMQNAQKLNKAQRENVAISLQLATSDGKNERNKQLQLLEEQIKSLDPHFYDKLETKYPNLTRGELRLIAFMKLRMSNQDVMEVMNITLSALQKSRYRLRKKLGVPERENLEYFIAKL